MRLLFVGPLWEGSTAQHRCDAFGRLPGVRVIPLDSEQRVGKASLSDRIRHRLRLPADRSHVNARVVAAARDLKPGIVFIDSCRLLRPDTLKLVRELGCCRLAFYSPDDVSAAHNSSRQLEASDQLWDVFFTTKSFNVPELRARGVKHPSLIRNAFDPHTHWPLTPSEVGPGYESSDVVLVGTWERPRMDTVNHLAVGSISVRVFGNGWDERKLHPTVRLSPACYGLEYTRALHLGRVALCPLRKLNRDLVTTRSVEIPAAARLMAAEKTIEHDELFQDGSEYISYRSDDELVDRLNLILRDEELRRSIATAGRVRCLRSGYSTDERAVEMLSVIKSVTSGS